MKMLAFLALALSLLYADREELLVGSGAVGKPGGRLVVALRSEPKTFNPLSATDGPSRDVYGRMNASLIRINRETQKTEPALAKSWSVTADGLRYTLQLRRGLRFSDGQPFDADDVVFTWQAYLDERNRSPHRENLIVGGQPIAVKKLDAHTVVFELRQPYAVGERLFDGIAMLPRHLLQKAQAEGKLAEAWGVGAPPAQIAGLGPFRLKAFVPGERVVLERNPHYWKADRNGRRLPYLDELTFLSVASEDAQVIRFQAGDTDMLSRVSAENFAVLARDAAARGHELRDLGPGLEYTFLFFNLGERGKGWFKDAGFRRAVSLALDRPGMARLGFGGRATPLGSHVTPGNKLWVDASLAAPAQSPERGRELLKASGFAWRSDGALIDAKGQPVEFSLTTNASNAARVKLATIAQDDLRALGIKLDVAPLDTGAVLDRVLKTRDYDAAILAFGAGDADPNVEMNIWLSSGASHLWNPGQPQPATPWEAEIDRLMRAQLVATKYEERKKLYDRVQRIVAEELPMIPLLAPRILVGAKAGLRNFRPAILDHYTLWNADELYWGAPAPSR
jgi:peptide/nickel transport system substrate-binding protein